MKIGYAQTTITPALDRPVYLAGFGNNRRAQTIHDDLFARALCISDGQATIVLCALDLIGFFRHDMRDVIKTLQNSKPFQALLPEVLIASTHTHHGPDTLGLWGPDQKTCGVDSTWMSLVKDKIAQVILAAISDLQPAALKYASVHVPGLAKNARNPEILDDELTVAQFTNPGGKALATLFNFPCHPEVLWEHNPHITSDYPAFLRAEVEKISGAPGIFFAGSLGGMMTPDVKDHSFAEAEAMGKALAAAGLAALSAADEQPQASISLQKREIRARLTNVLYKLAFRRRLLPDIRDQKGYMTSEVSLVRLGGLWLATVPGELLPKLGLAVKAEMKKAGAQVTGIIGLANDELGYILPVEDFKYPWNPFRPGSHYEETNSIGKEIAPAVLEGLKTLM